VQSISAKSSLVQGQTSQGAEVRGAIQRLTRQLVVFEVYSPVTVLMVSEVITGFKILLKDVPVYCGSCVIRNVVSTGLGTVCEAVLQEGWLDVDFATPVSTPGRLAESINSYLQEWQKQYKVLPEFKCHIADMQMFLMELRLWLEQVELGIRAAPTGDHPQLENDVANQVKDTVISVMDGLFEKLEILSTTLPEEVRPLHRAYVRKQLHPLVLCAPFAHRTFTKPLGYAGDYAMVNMISRNAIEGDSLFSKVVNCWFLHQRPAEAHRNRLHYLTQKLTEETVRVNMCGGPARIFNLACGPAVEVQNFIREREISDRAHISLLDFNEETLSYVTSVLNDIKTRHGRSTRFETVKKSVQQLLKEASKAIERPRELQYDMVYCAGLFDYLADPICLRLMNIMYQWLAPAGLLLVTNVHPSNPMLHGMDFVLDWHLIYRDSRRAKLLRPARANPDDLTVRSDSTGVDLFIEVRKPSHA
jgi:extracellular factor (EF) 3-hydroxypalmitic acid methyl ester biosynthesis protein